MQCSMETNLQGQAQYKVQSNRQELVHRKYSRGDGCTIVPTSDKPRNPPLSAGRAISLTTPAPSAIVEAEPAACTTRRTIKSQNAFVGTNARPIQDADRRNRHATYAGRRPLVSDRGAHIFGAEDRLFKWELFALDYEDAYISLERSCIR